MVWVLSAIILFVLVNILFITLAFRSIDRSMEKINWKDLSPEKFVRGCYDFVADRFEMVRHCYVVRPWRNFFYRNLWKAKGKGLPCHVFTIFFNRCLRKRMSKKDVKTIFYSKFPRYPWVHFYSKVRLNGKWLSLEPWGKKRGVIYGKVIYGDEV